MATASGGQPPFSLPVDEFCMVAVYNENPENTNANVILDCFITDKPFVASRNRPAQPPAYTPPQRPVYQAPPPAYSAPHTKYYAWVPYQTFPTAPPILRSQRRSGKVYIQFPVPCYTQTQSTEILKENFLELLKDYATVEYSFITIPIDDIKTWTKSKFCEAVLEEFLRWNEKRRHSFHAKLSFCTLERHNFDEAVKGCKKVIGGAHSKSVQANFKEGNPMPVCVVVGKLNEFKSGVSASFSSDVWKSAKERNEEEIVKKALQNHRAILNEETMKMEILPLYQRHSSGIIENKCASKYDVHTQSTEKSASFCFENISKEITINDVSPLLWDLLKSKFPDDFDNFEKKFGKITFHEPKIELTIPKNSDEAAEFVSKLEDYVQKLKDKDIHEVPIDKNIDAVAAWCKEIDAMENPFCVLNKEKKMVYVFCDTYDEVMKVKYQLALKIGTVKPTGIGRRGGARLKVKESMQKDTSNMSS